MPKSIVAIVGTYRKGRVIDSAVAEVLRGAEACGASTETIHLIDRHIEFCTNCRTCTQQPDLGRRGKCVQNDDLEAILQAIDGADGLVLASPTNFYNVTAVTRRFMERLVGYAYWPWNSRSGPKMRGTGRDKKAVTITTTACPAFLARILMPGATKSLKIIARTVGAKVQASLLFGTVAVTAGAILGDKDRARAYRAGELLARSL